MKYRNLKTGVIIDSSSEIKDQNWELIAPGSSVIKQEEKKETPKVESVAPKAVEKKATESNKKKTAIIHPRKKKEG